MDFCTMLDNHRKKKKKKHTRVFEVVSVIVRKGLHLAIVVHFTESKLLGGSQ